MASELDIEDSRVRFIADYVLKSLNLKGDKWSKMYSVEDNRVMLAEFFEKTELKSVFVLLTPAGSLQVQYECPSSVKNKGCYFTKKEGGNISKGSSLNKVLLYGDISYSPLEQFSVFVDEVSYFSLCFKFELNMYRKYFDIFYIFDEMNICEIISNKL